MIHPDRYSGAIVAPYIICLPTDGKYFCLRGEVPLWGKLIKQNKKEHKYFSEEFDWWDKYLKENYSKHRLEWTPV